jgi:nucleoid DNA-binding protein
MAKAKTGGKKAMTKSQLYSQLAEETDLKKADIVNVMEAFEKLVKNQLGPKGPGIFTLPGIARFKIRKVAAVKGGIEKKNPLTGQMYITKDRPAHNKLGIRPVKAFSETLK